MCCGKKLGPEAPGILAARSCSCTATGVAGCGGDGDGDGVGSGAGGVRGEWLV